MRSGRIEGRRPSVCPPDLPNSRPVAPQPKPEPLRLDEDLWLGVARAPEKHEARPAKSKRPRRPSWLKRVLGWKSETPVRKVLARTSHDYALTPAERDRLERTLRDLSVAKEREFWDMRVPEEIRSIVARSGMAAGITLLAGLGIPSQLVFPYVAGTLISIAGRLPVLYRRVEDALEGQAELEMERAGRSKPKTWYQRIADRIAGAIARRVLAKKVEKYALDPELAERLRACIDDVATVRKRELVERRLGVELAAVAGTAVGTVALGALFGALTAPGIAIAMLVSLMNAALAGVFALLKLDFTVEAAADAELKEIAKEAVDSPELARLHREAGHRERLALERAREIGDRYADAHGLSDGERRELHEILAGVARNKEKDLWDKRVGPTLLKPIARGMGVTFLAGAVGLTTPGGTVSLFLAAVVEAVISTFMLFRKFDHAVEGAAHGFCEARRSSPALNLVADA